MEQILKQILAKLENLESDIKELKSVIKEDHKLIKELKPKAEESHQWIRTLVEHRELQKAETDNLKHEIAKVEGVLKGFGKCLEMLKEA